MWRVISGDFEQVSHLRREVRSHLEPLADPDGDLEGAELAVSELLTNAAEHGAGPITLDLDWTGEHPILTVSDLGTGVVHAPATPAGPHQLGGRGLAIVRAVTLDLTIRNTAMGPVISATLDLRRRVPSPDVRSPRSLRLHPSDTSAVPA
ncbi:MAG: ATP-binding protein [Actinomycetota bacterium]|mgnify:CR=1 FL=1